MNPLTNYDILSLQYEKGDNNLEKWNMCYFCCDTYFLKVQGKLMGLFSFVWQGHETFLK